LPSLRCDGHCRAAQANGAGLPHLPLPPVLADYAIRGEFLALIRLDCQEIIASGRSGRHRAKKTGQCYTTLAGSVASGAHRLAMGFSPYHARPEAGETKERLPGYVEGGIGDYDACCLCAGFVSVSTSRPRMPGSARCVCWPFSLSAVIF